MVQRQTRRARRFRSMWPWRSRPHPSPATRAPCPGAASSCQGRSATVHPVHRRLALIRLSRKFLRNLRYGSERPKVDETCGRVSSLGLQYCTGEQNFAFPGSKRSNSLGNRALHAPENRTHTTKIRILSTTTQKMNSAKLTYVLYT